MIKSWEKLGEFLAEIENRLSVLENSQPYSIEKTESLQLPQEEWSKRQWDAFQQLQSEVRGWRPKHAEMMLAVDRLTKKPKKSKWD